MALGLVVAGPGLVVAEPGRVWGWMREWMQGRVQEQGAVRTPRQTGVTGSQWRREETMVVTMYKIPYFRKTTTTHTWWLHFYLILILFYSLLLYVKSIRSQFKLEFVKDH